MSTIDIHLTPGAAPQAAAAPPSEPAGVGAVDEATALMFAAERGAIKSIQSWQQRGGNLDTLLVHQVRFFFCVCAGLWRQCRGIEFSAASQRSGASPPPPPPHTTP
jgi:hypothetical protein